MPLTGAPGARHPLYLLPLNYQRYPDLDDSGHAPDALAPCASEDIDTAGAEDHDASESAAGCETGWVDPLQVYVQEPNGEVTGFLSPGGSMAMADQHAEDAR